MKIQISMKHAGNIAKRVKVVPFELAVTPTTFGELIEESVRTSLVAYRARMRESAQGKPLTDEAFSAMQEVGRFAWAFLGEEKDVDEEKAIAIAKEGVKDGVVRVFMGERELKDFEEKIEVNADVVFTFVKLTMLAGRLW